jgi:hypothetical protein
MAVQIKYPDGTFQWIPGELYSAHDGFTIARKGNKPRDFVNDHKVVSTTFDSQVVEWRRRREWSYGSEIVEE